MLILGLLSESKSANPSRKADPAAGMCAVPFLALRSVLNCSLDTCPE
jgi:hypothetical protein